MPTTPEITARVRDAILAAQNATGIALPTQEAANIACELLAACGVTADEDVEIVARGIVADLATSDSTHNCDDNAVPYESDGALGHGWECGVCGAFLQAG